MGVGLGNFNTKYGIAQMMQCIGQPNRFPNSFLYFIAEGGILAVALVLIGTVYLGYHTLKSKKWSFILLFAFIVIYQIPGGYFSNPLNWICYGILLTKTKESVIVGK